MGGQRGFQLGDLTVALAVFGLAMAVGVPQLLRITADLRLRLAADEVVASLRQAASLAVRTNREVALRFDIAGHQGSSTTFTLYRDGDGDGVTNEDIRSGVDPQVAPAGRLEHVGGEIRFGLPSQRVRDPGDPGHYLEGDDPIRFNDSNLASFGPLGTSTPGSVYLTDGGSHLVAVRVYGRTGHIRVLHYDFAAQVWR
ncbi:MAG TPA: GspH/FimT family pseudopilin [Thermoanaerobaculia bacterium]|nr:GspH/FimT family pseudopilin [Thermoanaerobaculia bacterium]